MLNLIVPLFALIAAGYLLRRVNILNKRLANIINKLVFYIGLPALLFKSISTSHFNTIFSYKLILNYHITIMLGILLALLLSTNIKRPIRGALVMCSFRGNIAYLGLPIISFTLGNNAEAMAGVLIGFFVPFEVIASIILLSFYNKRSNIKLLVKETVLNPLILAVAIGLIFSVSNIPLPKEVYNLLSLIAKISLPLILLIAGSSISFRNTIKYARLDILTSVIKLILLPIIGLFIFKYLFYTPYETTKIAIILLAMPTAINTFTFAKELGADEKYTASQIGLSMLISLITIPLTIMLLGG